MKAHPLSRIVKRDDVPEGGLEITIDASADERAAIAALFGIPAVESLTGHLTVTPWRGRGLAVRGTVEARVVQTCVVTLDPVHNTVREDVETFFAPATGRRVEPEAEGSAEAPDLDMEDLIDERIDIGALAAEHVALGLETYPRKPGVAFEAGQSEEDDEKSSPFAVLSALKNGRRDN